MSATEQMEKVLDAFRDAQGCDWHEGRRVDGCTDCERLGFVAAAPKLLAAVVAELPTSFGTPKQIDLLVPVTWGDSEHVIVERDGLVAVLQSALSRLLPPPRATGEEDK